MENLLRSINELGGIENLVGKLFITTYALKGREIEKVILVGANSGHSEKMNKTENNKGFYSKEGFDFNKIKNHCNNFVVLHSTDDEWVPFSAGEENAKGLAAKFLRFEDMGHFGIKVPGQKIPELSDEILSELK